MLALFFSAFVVAFSGAIMPGPVMTYTIEKALIKGRYAGFTIILGHAVLEIALIISILSGFLLSASNPYFIFWWAVVGLSFIIQSYNKLGYIGVLVYFLGHISADFLIYGSISLLVSSAKKFIQGKAYRIIIVILGCAMVCFGAKFLIGAIITII